MDAEHAAYVVAHRNDLPESEVDKAERWLAHNDKHQPRLTTGHYEESEAA